MSNSLVWSYCQASSHWHARWEHSRQYWNLQYPGQKGYSRFSWSFPVEHRLCFHWSRDPRTWHGYGPIRQFSCCSCSLGRCWCPPPRCLWVLNHRDHKGQPEGENDLLWQYQGQAIRQRYMDMTYHTTMQRAVERDSESRSDYAMCAVNPSQVSPTFSDAALCEVVDSIATCTASLLRLLIIMLR